MDKTDRQTTATRLPEYLKRGIVEADDPMGKKIRGILKEYKLNTVCDSARCPNKKECYCKGSATFMIMGNACTRNCKFCNIEQKCPGPLDPKEPENIAKAISKLNLEYCVITSVTRDDLKDGGAEHFSKTIFEVRKKNRDIKIEVLIPDFRGGKNALNTVLDAKPDVLNHNIETTKNHYRSVREMADYAQSLEVLRYAKSYNHEIITKTGIMVGLGETVEELEECFKDIKSSDVDILTIGQYISPSKKHLEVAKYYSLEEFEQLKGLATAVGIGYCVSSPLARSSYMAKEAYNSIIMASPF